MGRKRNPKPLGNRKKTTHGQAISCNSKPRIKPKRQALATGSTFLTANPLTYFIAGCLTEVTGHCQCAEYRNFYFETAFSISTSQRWPAGMARLGLSRWIRMPKVLLAASKTRSATVTRPS